MHFLKNLKKETVEIDSNLIDKLKNEVISKDRVIRKLHNCINSQKSWNISPVDIYQLNTEQDPNVNSTILNNLYYLINGYIAINGMDEEFEKLVVGLIDEIQSLYS